MGMQGPLTAQALGRSPYDDVVEGEGEDDPREPPQQYDQGGRPINPDTMRINRDIIRSHNEVMLVIGVAEPENPNLGPEADLQRRHELYESEIGIKIVNYAQKCVESVGMFGVGGLRDRILLYKRYSHIPFWDLYKQARRDSSLPRDILSGVPASLVNGIMDWHIFRFWYSRPDSLARWCAHKVWSYVGVHLRFFSTMQRLGLIPSSQWLPTPAFFIPFSHASPIVTCPPLDGFGSKSMVRWLLSTAMSSSSFFVWYMSRRLYMDWRPKIWGCIMPFLPQTSHREQSLYSVPPSRSSEACGNSSAVEDGPASTDAPAIPEAEPVEAVRRPSIFSTRDEDYASDEENEGVRATLISFDVEATESSADAPQGLWSAELRPSVAPDSRSATSATVVYNDTLLTQASYITATQVLTNSATRILMAPYEATALRLVARAFRIRAGLPWEDLHLSDMWTGLSWTFAVNFLGSELLYFLLTTGVWAVFTGISQWYHMSEEEFKEYEEGLSHAQ